MATTRLHDQYDGLSPDAPVNLHDVAALAEVQRDTAYKWSTRAGFPAPADDGTWQIGAVVAWLCSTGRLTGCQGELLRRSEVAALVGLAVSTVKVYLWKGDFPAPVDSAGRHPLWRRSDIEAWMDGRVDRRTIAGKEATA